MLFEQKHSDEVDVYGFGGDYGAPAERSRDRPYQLPGDGSDVYAIAALYRRARPARGPDLPAASGSARCRFPAIRARV